MSVKNSAVVECDELVLAATIDGAHDGTCERAPLGRGQTASQRAMKKVDAVDSLADDGAAQTARCGFDFGELGHGTGTMTANGENNEERRQQTKGNCLTGSSTLAQVGRVSVSADWSAVRRALLVVLVLNAVVAGVKVVVGLHTGTLTVLGAALESGLDMLNNVIGVALVGVASRAPDEDHPYGHDKFETLGALAIVGFLSISCFELLREGITALATHRAPGTIDAGDVGIIAGTLLLNAFVVWYERARGRALGSAFLLADASHTTGDIFVTLLALAALVFTRLGLAWLDAPLAIAVALLIAWSGVGILRQSIPVLVDQRAIEASALRTVVMSVAGIQDVRKTRSRATASGQLFAEVTIVVGGRTSVDDAHTLADAVEAAIERAFGTSEVTVHVEPA